MKHYFYQIALLIAAILFPTQLLADGKTIYGFSRDYPYGLLKIDSENPGNTIKVKTSDVWPTAGAIKGETMYIFGMDDDFNTLFYSVDLETGDVEKIKNLGEAAALPMEMTYDYADEKMYFVTNSDASEGMSALYTVDLSTGKMTKLTDNIGIFVRGLAATVDGELYALNGSGLLYHISKTSLTASYVGNTGRSITLFQSMAFDRATGTLYLANYGSGKNTLCTINPNTGATTEIGTIGTGNGIWTVALDVPFKASEAAAPAKVSDLKAVADETGELKATISWTNPTLTAGGETLNSITKATITRGDDELVGELTSLQPGQPASIVDNNVPEAGTYRYHVRTQNASGRSADQFIDVYVGHDVLGPSLLPLADLWGSDKIANVITWHAPETGAHGGYIVTDDIKYDIIRLNDQKKLAENQSFTSDSKGMMEYVDEDVTSLARYTYAIIAKNVDGEGEKAETNFIVNGPAQKLPYTADFNQEADALLWTPFNANGDYSEFEWHYYVVLNRNLYLYQAHETNYAADFLISPPLEFIEGHAYDITVSAANSFAPYPETFTVYTMGGNAPHGALIGGIVGTENPLTINHPDELREYTFSMSAIPDDGNGIVESFPSFIAVACVSDPDMSMLLVGDVKIVDKGGPEPSGITLNRKGEDNASAPFYNLSGQRVGNDYRGIVICNGKKMLRK